MRKALVMFSMLLCAIRPIFGQDRFTFSGSRTHCSIPFLLYRNLIVVPLRINGRGPFNFILDSGVGYLILTNASLKDELGLKAYQKITIKGLGSGSDADAMVVNNITLDLGASRGRYFSAALLLKKDLDFSTYVGMPVDGIIGYDVFNSFAVKIDYQSRKITLWKQASYKASKVYHVFPISVEGGKPYLYANSSCGKNKIKLLIDTGAGNPLLLDHHTDTAIQMPVKGLRSRLGVGLSGFIEGVLSRSDRLSFGPYSLKNIICAYPYAMGNMPMHEDTIHANGNLGNEILKRFVVVFDYVNLKLYLKPTSGLKQPFEYDMSGLDLMAIGNDYKRFVVAGVDRGSPAEKAGLKESDELLFINLFPATHYSVSDLDELLRSEDRKPIPIIYRRNTKISMTNLVLKRRI